MSADGVSVDAGPTGGDKITIVIADDHQMVRAGLRRLLEVQEDFEVVSTTAATGSC